MLKTLGKTGFAAALLLSSTATWAMTYSHTTSSNDEGGCSAVGYTAYNASVSDIWSSFSVPYLANGQTVTVQGWRSYSVWSSGVGYQEFSCSNGVVSTEENGSYTDVEWFD